MSDPQHDRAAKIVFAALVKFVTGHSELFKPLWVERREAAKIVISLSSASLIFSITFSTSIIKPWTPMTWRYYILVSWILLVASLISAIGSLWFAMELSGLPALVTISEEKILEHIKTAMSDPKFGELQAGSFIGEHTRKFERHDLTAAWLLRGSLVLFGCALLMLTIVGALQLFY